MCKYPTLQEVQADIRWVMVRPGVYKWKPEGIPTYSSEHPTSYFCQDCGALHGDGPMLVNDLWLRLFPGGGVACWECMERRAGRELAVGDLKEVPMNKVPLLLLNRLKQARTMLRQVIITG